METIIKASPIKPRRKFAATFKLEAVRNWQASGKSAAVVAKELGLAENRLFAWRKLLPAAGGRRRGISPRSPSFRPGSMPPCGRSVTCAGSGTF
jgi:transposase-like protein